MGHGHSPAAKRIAQRQMVRSVPCPKCSAKAGQKCIGVRVKARAASHQERWDAYREQQTNQTN